LESIINFKLIKIANNHPGRIFTALLFDQGGVSRIRKGAGKSKMMVYFSFRLNNNIFTQFKRRKEKRRGGKSPRGGGGAMLMNSDDDGLCCCKPNTIRPAEVTL